jgi:hypothetical protein
MIKKRKMSTRRNGCAAATLMHFETFACPCLGLRGRDQSLQGLVFDGFSLFVRAQDHDRYPGAGA